MMKKDRTDEEIIHLTRELVRTPSVNPPADTRRCADLILNAFQKEQIESGIVEGRTGACNVVARLPGKGRGKTLLLNGHMDVVPPGENWTVDPFGAEIRDNRIYGRGSSDMKSGIASMMAAMIEMKRSGIPFYGEILFAAVCDEETGSEFGTVHLLKKGFGKNADFAIVAEPTRLRVEIGNRGLRWIDITVRGKASHAGRPHLGTNAIFYGARLVEAIHSMKFKNRNDAFDVPEPSLSVTMIHGGTKENIIPDRCDLVVDRRMIPGETTETVLGEMRETIGPIVQKERELKIDMKVRPNFWDPYLISKKEPIVQALVESVEEVTGEKPGIGAKSGCTDGSHLFHLGGIPTVLFGPGDARLGHQADEWVAIEDILKATDVMLSIFNRLLHNT
jgi:acetylornithine deacetylase/succinyl-diaminopimelate desuccinylase family protein